MEWVPNDGLDLEFGEKLSAIQDELLEALGESRSLRIAIALYDEESDMLRTFASNFSQAPTLFRYGAKLSDIPSLSFARHGDSVRIVNDMRIFDASESYHSQRLLEIGYRSSYAKAIREGPNLLGIIFLNSTEPGYFDASRCRVVAPIMYMIELLVVRRSLRVRAINAVLVAAQEIGAYRDTDTGAHLRRMAHIARIIGEGISSQYGLGDAFVDQVYSFAPLHDIGKVGIPDTILLKPGPLTDAEVTIMKGHTEIGTKMIDRIVDRLCLQYMTGIDVMRHIVLYHHEKLDGSGYPEGRRGGDIPIEAQIVAVADVFDALTSQRPYKEPWPLERASRELAMLKGAHLNSHCVDALLQDMGRTQEIMARFQD